MDRIRSSPRSLNVDESHVDQLLSLLKHRYRRYIIQRLWAADHPLMLEQLAIEIAAQEEEVAVEKVRQETAEYVQTVLHDTHIPKLTDAFVLEYDKTRGVVFLTDRVLDLEPLVMPMSDAEINATDD